MVETVRFRRGFWSVLAGACAALGGCGGAVTDKNVKMIQVAEVRSLMERVQAGERSAMLVIDPRTPDRFAEGHIPGARNMSLPPLEAGGSDPALTPYGMLVVAGDNRADALARAMAKRLLQLRYKGVRLFAGGLEEWERAGHPVERGAGADPGTGPGAAR